MRQPSGGWYSRGMKISDMKKHKAGSVILSVAFVLCATLTVWLAASAVWAFTNWSNLHMEEIIYELTAPLTGTGNDMIGKYVIKCVVPAAVTAAVLFLLLFLLRKKKWIGRVKVIGLIVSFAGFACTLVYAWIKLDFGSFIANYGKPSTYIADNYVDPSMVDITFPQHKRNLIYIYLESMEMTYADKANGGGFDFNCIPELTKLAEENEDFSGSDPKLNGGIALNGATWTVGAMFAQTSGLPLKTSLDTNGMSSQSVFFPGIMTLGDILEEEGYDQTLMLGSNATFGGRRLYFTEHGHYDIRDYEYSLQTGQIPQGYKVWWGYEDEKLFSFAKERLTQLGSGDKPFNFTMLTVDTHFPDGYVCRLCDDEFAGNQYANVMHCSSRQVTAFVEWCQQQPWYDNTTIIISGDHPTMDADFCNDVSKDYQRRVYTCYINAAPTVKDPTRKRTYSTFDDFPTTLAALGCHIDGNRLGLGVNLFSDEPTLIERDGLDNVNTELMRDSEFMRKASAISDQALEVRSKISAMKPKIKVKEDDQGYLEFKVKGLKNLDQYADEVRYVYLQIRNSNQLILTSPKLNRWTDGSYRVNLPVFKLNGNKDITYMLKVYTKDGTIDLTDAIPYSLSE
jgi:phosphoglycerol transferase